MSDESPVVVYTTPDLMEASQLKCELEAAGFACELLNVQHSTMLPGGGLAIGIRLIVPRSQAVEAAAFIDDALKRWAQADPKAEERARAGREGVVRCGSCGEPLDPDSVFCDQCGAPVRDGPRDRPG